MTTRFEGLKNIHEEAKQTAMRETIKSEQFNDEINRIFEDLEELLGQPVEKAETADLVLGELKESIASHESEYVKVLRELGYTKALRELGYNV